jgi:hypothetical protein
LVTQTEPNAVVLLNRDQAPKRVIVNNEKEEGAKKSEAQQRPEPELSPR